MVSVLMSTYNRANYLRRAMDSVLNQTYQDIEFVIVDDGSTDGSRELIESYDDERIKFIPLERNSYYCFAANYGLKSCMGQYIAFMNSDDIWLPEKLEKQVAFLEQNPEYGACFSDVYLIDNDGNDITDKPTQMRGTFSQKNRTQKEWLEYLLCQRNVLCHPSALVRKDVLDQVGGFNLLFCQLADYDLWIRIVAETPIHVFQEKLIKFRWDIDGQNQISSATEGKVARDYNERLIIRRESVERLTDEQFKKFFGDRFKNPDSTTHLEIEFEKAFFLAECMEEAPNWKILGMDKLEKVLRLPEAVETLRNHFGMDIFEIYEWNKTYMYRDPLILDICEQQKRTIEWQEERYRQEVEAHRKQVDEFLNSTSWKMTAPLRRLMGKLKGNKL